MHLKLKIQLSIIVSLWLYLALNFTCSGTKKIILNTQKTDSIIYADKKNIINKAVHEVFASYLDSILFYKKTYNSSSVMTYIYSYIKRQNDSIVIRIANKSYTDRFGLTQKIWIKTDYVEVAALIKARTLDRIKEISADVEINAPNILNTTTNDKEELLEKEVRAEIKE